MRVQIIELVKNPKMLNSVTNLLLGEIDSIYDPATKQLIKPTYSDLIEYKIYKAGREVPETVEQFTGISHYDTEPKECSISDEIHNMFDDLSNYQLDITNFKLCEEAIAKFNKRVYFDPAYLDSE